MVKSGKTDYLLGVIRQYEILGFCRLGIYYRGNFTEPKLGRSSNKTKYQPTTDSLRIHAFWQNCSMKWISQGFLEGAVV
jgi:hypothetical protein